MSELVPGVARCPHCQCIFGRRTMPLLDGTPVLICTACHRISTDTEWSTP